MKLLSATISALGKKAIGRFKFTYDHNGLIVLREEMGLFRSINKIEPSQSDLLRFCEIAEDLYIWLSLSKVQTLSLGKAYLEPMKNCDNEGIHRLGRLLFSSSLFK